MYVRCTAFDQNQKAFRNGNIGFDERGIDEFAESKWEKYVARKFRLFQIIPAERIHIVLAYFDI